MAKITLAAFENHVQFCAQIIKKIIEQFVEPFLQFIRFLADLRCFGTLCKL